MPEASGFLSIVNLIGKNCISVWFSFALFPACDRSSVFSAKYIPPLFVLFWFERGSHYLSRLALNSLAEPQVSLELAVGLLPQPPEY